jgi:hypothetical protein
MKVLKWMVGVFFVGVVYVLGLWLWNIVPPRRPVNVARSAVFLFGLPVGAPFPIPKRGTWVNCWLDEEHGVNRCSAVWADGTFIYEGSFVRFEGTGPVPQNELQIDTKAIGDSVYFKGATIPIIHLRNGTILIPAEASEEAERQTLDWLRQNQKH